MNSKVIGGISALTLLVAMSTAFADYNGAFSIEVTVDTTIFLPDLCENGGSTSGVLEFEPGITGLDDSAAVAIDTCASGSTGDWSVEMAGNVPLDLYFELQNASPQGITVALWGDHTGATPDSTFTNNPNYINLTNTDAQNPLWAQNIPDGATLQIWQRVAADTTAIGGSSATNQIIVTSQRHV